ncbi:MAG TPA: hypothetical protein VE615_01550 [Gaiellaceae bacterium]|jgi:hypothetical protein|nr:hypothetical protein [Gaiellaceae bacterium]
MLAGAARRLFGLFAVVGGATLFVSLLLGLLTDSSLRRSIAVGFYVVGSILLIAGFFVGNRGVLRADTDETAKGGMLMGFRRRGIRSATGEEQRESVRVSALIIGLGIALLLLGTLADTENKLA